MGNGRGASESILHRHIGVVVEVSFDAFLKECTVGEFHICRM